MAARALSLVAAVLALLVVGSHALNSWKAGTSFHHTYLSGISFTSPTQGWLAGFDGFHNGARIFNTSNAGASWGNHTFTRHDSLSFTCIAMDPSGRGTVAGNGVLTTSGLAYTSDFGATWSDSEILHLEGRFRDCGLVPGTNGSSVWTVGQWFKIQDLHGEGVALSEDGGHRFRYFDWEIGVPSRFGSFLTKNFGYVSGGRYPQVLFENRDRTVRVSSEDKNVMRLSGLLAYYKGEMMHATQVRDHTYLGAIARTDDRGRRFNLMYNSTLNNLNVCFNGISFIDSFHGWVVAEGYNLTTGKHGGWIFSTANGGITWKQLLYVEHVSFLRIRMLNANEGWAIGGRVPSPFLVSGEFYHTTDGGKTWDSETHRDVFPLNLDLIDSKNGFATGLTLRGDTQVFQYKTRQIEPDYTGTRKVFGG